MFLIRIDHTPQLPESIGHLPTGPSLGEQVRHLRQDARWQEVATAGCRLVWCTGPGTSPVVSAGGDGSWFLSFGTPSAPSQGIITRPDHHEEAQNFFVQGQFPDHHQLEGTFVLAGYHHRTRTLRLITDRSGVAPLYVHQDGEGLWVSSSALAIACVTTVKVSPEGLACILGNEFPLRHWSLFDGVERIGPGAEITYRNGQMAKRDWWRPDGIPLSSPSIEGLAEDIATRIPPALNDRYRGRRQMNCSLTAGLDSRCMAALLARSGVPASFFTYDSGPAWEAEISEKLAAVLGSGWALLREDLSLARYRTVTEQSALLGDGENQPFRGTSYWSSATGGPGRTILWGFGGEIWRDYWSKHEQAAFLLRGSDVIERLVRNRTYGCGLADDDLNPAFRAGMRRFVTEQYRLSFAEMPADGKLDRLDMLYITERVRRWASVHLNTSGWWAVTDAPLMSQHLLQLAFRLPRSIKKSSELMRSVIYKASPAASRLPHNGGYHSLPAGHAGSRERLHSLTLDGRKLASRLPLLSRMVRKDQPGKPSRLSSWTYRQMFADCLDGPQMASAHLFHEPSLAALVANHANRPIGQSRPLDFIIGLEFVLRAAKKLAT